MLSDIISLPFLERRPEPLVRVVLVIGLVLVVFDTNEIAIDAPWIERQADESIDDGCFGDDPERPCLSAKIKLAYPGSRKRRYLFLR